MAGSFLPHYFGTINRLATRYRKSHQAYQKFTVTFKLVVATLGELSEQNHRIDRVWQIGLPSHGRVPMSMENLTLRQLLATNWATNFLRALPL